MPKYRKKPVVIEAMQYTMESKAEVVAWLHKNKVNFDGALGRDPGDTQVYLFIHTHEGGMAAGYGDWIIKGIKDEFYPVKPDIFHKTYDVEPDFEYKPFNGNKVKLHPEVIKHLLGVGTVIQIDGKTYCYDPLWRKILVGSDIAEVYSFDHLPQELKDYIKEIRQ